MIRLAGMMLLCLIALWGEQSHAQSQNCIGRVNHQELIIVAGTVTDQSPGLRERFMDWPARQWDNAWGAAPDCDSATTIAFLARMLSLEETEGYCLADAEDGTGFLLVPGVRNYRGRCTVTACDRVSMLASDAFGVARGLTSLIAGREINSTADGVTAIASGSGAMLVTGQTPAVVSALGQTATALGAALSAPAAATAAAVTVVTVGGAVYVCSE